MDNFSDTGGKPDNLCFMFDYWFVSLFSDVFAGRRHWDVWLDGSTCMLLSRMVIIRVENNHDVLHTFLFCNLYGSDWFKPFFVVLSCSGLVSDCFHGFPQEGQRQDGRV